MVRFSCFNSQMQHHRSKGVSQSVGLVQNLTAMKESYDNSSEINLGHVSTSEGALEFFPRVPLKKSQSLGCGLDREGSVSSCVDREDDMDKYSSYGDLNENSYGVLHLNSSENHNHQADTSFQRNNLSNNQMHKKSIFSIGEISLLEGCRRECSSPQLSGDDVGESENYTFCTPFTIVRSRSLPASKSSSIPRADPKPWCRSFEDLVALNAKGTELVRKAAAHQQQNSHIKDTEELDSENTIGDEYDFYNFSDQVPAVDEVELMENFKSRQLQRWDEFPSKHFKAKRIEEWVNMIDIDQSNPLHEVGEPLQPTNDVMKNHSALGNATNMKLEAKSTHAMEMAKKYIATLTASSASAQLSTLGLVMVPHLSAFVSLKVLNLSGNGLVKISSGALPRGLHTLNLAKNNISTIEGFRELTRLRILDLSYNKILRIGHGLGYCSSLKELYLAGNKIGEVEGLHRLLKLKVLDLRFNKISTAKCLGLLAANLEAISLEGNPAQRNVGDEQLKKYLQGLLPSLVYYNKQPIKASSSKDVIDRSVRSTVTERGLRADHKLPRKGVPTSKSSSSSYGHTVQATGSPNRLKERHRHLPPTGAKGTRHNYVDLGSKLLGFRADLSMRRSHSEGNLGTS